MRDILIVLALLSAIGVVIWLLTKRKTWFIVAAFLLLCAIVFLAAGEPWQAIGSTVLALVAAYTGYLIPRATWASTEPDPLDPTDEIDNPDRHPLQDLTRQ